MRTSLVEFLESGMQDYFNGVPVGLGQDNDNSAMPMEVGGLSWKGSGKSEDKGTWKDKGKGKGQHKRR